MTTLSVLSAGAAQSLVEALRPDFAARAGARLACEFGPVGVVAARLRAGAEVDVVITSEAGMRTLAAEGLVRGGSDEPLGVVETALAGRAGDTLLPVRDGKELGAALATASLIYMPDPASTTAGGHLAAVVDRLGLLEQVRDRVRPCPNGEAVVRELRGSVIAGAIGCAQATEIVGAEGVALMGPLPGDYALSTLYAAGISQRSRQQELAQAFIRYLAGPDTEGRRRTAGFR